MKSIVCMEPGRFEMMEIPVPVPGPGEALIRILRVGICGTDLHAYRGKQPYFVYPRVLGHELAGEIVEIPDGLDSDLAVGDPVCVIPYVHCGTCIACRSGKTNCCTQMSVMGVHRDGGMQEYMTVPIRHLVKTEELAPEQAAIVECFSIGAHSVRVASVRPGDHVLVIGAGPIGLGAMRFAKLAGARVTAMDINEERLQFCRHWGSVDDTVIAGQEALAQVEKITGGDFPVSVIDATGNTGSMEQALHFVAHGGKLVYVGLVKSDITFHDPDFHKREMAIMGSRNAMRQDFLDVIEAMRNGQIDTDSYITHRASFAGLIGQYEHWLRPEAGVIKAIVEL